MTYRILITGSRTWTDQTTIRQALLNEMKTHQGNGGYVMINGNCPKGADAICKLWWKTWRLPLELYPADWEKYGKRAGFVRNKQMVDTGVDVCLAFIKDGSKGASMTAKLAEDAGVRTVRFEQ